MRDTCLYCELKGVETQLVRYAHWGVCPICSPDFLASVTAHAPTLPVPVLLGRGVPSPRP